ncbi:MAG TPA: hypothetical protein PKE07_02335 [Lacibacter sp.]|nr:hypothetical protein [Lacibacter sp.]HMO87861.1 hypothetical protein [Lacibacter sp.]
MRIFPLFLGLLLTAPLVTVSQTTPVQYKGAMRQLHRNGNASASVRVDSIITPHLFAVGPVAGLRGEIFVWDGRPFVAGITGERKESFVTKDVQPLDAVFLVYADVPAWDTLEIALQSRTIRELEQELGRIAAERGLDTLQPFPFLVLGHIAKGKGHIVYADTLTHQIQPGTLEQYKHYNQIEAQKAQLIGFYSQEHAGIFTHHDSYLHIHYRMYNKYQAGHLDEVAFDKNIPVLLLLPRKKQ